MPLTPEDKLKYKALYLQTAKPYVSQMLDILKALQNGQEDAEKLELIHRAAHSMSSQSQMMEYTNLGTLSGLIEKIFKAKIDKILELDQPLLEALTLAVDKMQASLTEIETNDRELDLSSEIASLRNLAHIPA
jgi:chemotaxis protein histidine kinase CheA